MQSYLPDLTCNPTADEISSRPETQRLIAAGFNGVVVPDYDPRNFEDNLDSLCVFKPLLGVTDWQILSTP